MAKITYGSMNPGKKSEYTRFCDDCQMVFTNDVMLCPYCERKLTDDPAPQGKDHYEADED